MPHPHLQTYRDGFFEKFLAELPGTPTLASLEHQQAGQPLAVLGDYIAYTAEPLTPVPNAPPIMPQFAVRTGGNGATQTYVMLWIVERFDVATDSPATIARILADFRPPTVSGSADEGVSSELAGKWSQALTADGVRQALARNLSEITAVPAGLPQPSKKARPVAC